MAWTKPSIIFDGAIMSAPALACETAVCVSSSRLASLITSPCKTPSTVWVCTIPQWPWSVNSHRQVSATTSSSGCHCLIMRVASCTIPFSSKPEEPMASFVSGLPNSGTAGMPSETISSTSSFSVSSEKW
ncbi:hypothetical protein D3C73_1250150 [compost metagenome]